MALSTFVSASRMRGRHLRAAPVALLRNMPRSISERRSNRAFGRKETSMHALKLIKNALAKGPDHLGDLVWWSLSEARVDRSTLEVIWNDVGLAPELLPEPPSTERSFKSAIKEAQVGQQGRLIRLAVETSDEII